MKLLSKLGGLPAAQEDRPADQAHREQRVGRRLRDYGDVAQRCAVERAHGRKHRGGEVKRVERIAAREVGGVRAAATVVSTSRPVMPLSASNITPPSMSVPTVVSVENCGAVDVEDERVQGGVDAVKRGRSGPGDVVRVSRGDQVRGRALIRIARGEGEGSIRGHHASSGREAEVIRAGERRAGG